MADPRKLAEDFVTGLKRALGDRVKSAALFGSAARGEWIEGVSDVNVLVLVDDIDARLLADAAPVARTSVPRGVMPLLMELGEWRRAADVFSIELADMVDAHTSLHGDDPVAHHTPVPGLLRLQAERELRGKLLHLHSGMLLAADDKARLGQLLIHALPSFITYMRVVLRLSGRDVPQESAQVIGQAAAVVGIEGADFLRVLRARAGREKLALGLHDPLAQNFNSSAQHLADFIDAHGKDSGT